MSRLDPIPNTFAEHVTLNAKMRSTNAEYLRGYREGQEAAALEFARTIDTMLGRYNQIASFAPRSDQKTAVLRK